MVNKIGPGLILAACAICAFIVLEHLRDHDKQAVSTAPAQAVFDHGLQSTDSTADTLDVIQRLMAALRVADYNAAARLLWTPPEYHRYANIDMLKIRARRLVNWKSYTITETLSQGSGANERIITAKAIDAHGEQLHLLYALIFSRGQWWCLGFVVKRSHGSI